MKKCDKISWYQSKIAFRLWGMMMVLVVLSIGFMWVVQIFLFEQNYTNSTVREVTNRLDPIIAELEEVDVAEDETLLVELSKATNNKLMVIAQDGNVIEMFSVGHRLIDEQSMETVRNMIDYIKQSEYYDQVLKGSGYNRVVQGEEEAFALEVGIPVTYNNEPAAIFLYNTFEQLHTVLNVNREQLIRLSVLLTVIAAVLAAILSRFFLKPIHQIKNAIDRLAEGELTARAGLRQNDELGDLSKSVDKLSQALQRVDVLRKEVIANVSHELRAPLSIIRGYAELIRDIHWTDHKKREEDLAIIIDETTRMSAMVNDIMDYSQLQAGYIQLSKEQEDLLTIVRQEVERSQHSADNYNIHIQLETKMASIPVVVDAIKIGQVMRNLLNNAINHTKNDAAIYVYARKVERGYRIEVVNPGEAISDEDCKLIWERYQRSQHHGGRNEGTGIGLSIVRTYLEAHDMTYGVYSQDGLTTFWFEIAE